MRHRVNRLMGGGRIVLWDSFTDADGAAVIDGHASEDGAPWQWAPALSVSSGVKTTGAIDTNRAKGANGEAGSVPVKGLNRFRRNGRVSADVIRTAAAQAEFIGVAQRIGVGNFVQARHNPNGTPQWGLTRFYEASAPNFLGSPTFNQTLTQDQVYRIDFDARGPVFLLWVDGVLRIRVEGYTRPRGGPGMRLQNQTANPAIMRLDNWMATR